MTVLFLTHRLPYAPNRGDRVRAYFLLKYLRARADVHVVSLVHDADEASHVSDLAPLAASVRTAMVKRARSLVRSVVALPSSQPLTHAMLDAPDLQASIDAAAREHQPDVILAYCSGMARFALERPLDTYPLVLDMVDVDSAKWRDLAAVSTPPLSWIYRREARVLAAFEGRAADHATATMVVTSRERDTLRALTPTARIEVVPNGVDVASLQPPGAPAPSANVVFCGVMNYPPNAHAAAFLAHEVWPLVRAHRADATLTIVGSHPTGAVRALSAAGSGVVVTGAVPDVRPYLWNAAIAAAPIVTARGIQNKVLEAVAAGLPTVVTPNIAAVLPPEVAPAVVSAGGRDAFAAAILQLLGRTPAERRAMANRADVAALAWDHQLASVGRLLDEAASGGSPRTSEAG